MMAVRLQRVLCWHKDRAKLMRLVADTHARIMCEDGALASHLAEFVRITVEDDQPTKAKREVPWPLAGRCLSTAREGGGLAYDIHVRYLILLYVTPQPCSADRMGYRVCTACMACLTPRCTLLRQLQAMQALIQLLPQPLPEGTGRALEASKRSSDQELCVLKRFPGLAEPARRAGRKGGDGENGKSTRGWVKLQRASIPRRKKVDIRGSIKPNRKNTSWEVIKKMGMITRAVQETLGQQRKETRGGWEGRTLACCQQAFKE